MSSENDSSSMDQSGLWLGCWAKATLLGVSYVLSMHVWSSTANVDRDHPSVIKRRWETPSKVCTFSWSNVENCFLCSCRNHPSFMKRRWEYYHYNYFCVAGPTLLFREVFRGCLFGRFYSQISDLLTSISFQVLLCVLHAPHFADFRPLLGSPRQNRSGLRPFSPDRRQKWRHE